MTRDGRAPSYPLISLTFYPVLLQAQMPKRPAAGSGPRPTGVSKRDPPQRRKRQSSSQPEDAGPNIPFSSIVRTLVALVGESLERGKDDPLADLGEVMVQLWAGPFARLVGRVSTGNHSYARSRGLFRDKLNELRDAIVAIRHERQEPSRRLKRFVSKLVSLLFASASVEAVDESDPLQQEFSFTKLSEDLVMLCSRAPSADLAKS